MRRLILQPDLHKWTEKDSDRRFVLSSDAVEVQGRRTEMLRGWTGCKMGMVEVIGAE